MILYTYIYFFLEMGSLMTSSMDRFRFQNFQSPDVDPDQMPHFVASDLGLHCLQSLSVPILRVITVSTLYLIKETWHLPLVHYIY